ncbi:hypothetical protein SLS58_005418 [Diplodia intermedia]|uniref:Uncharacterized protein n=1 Tax=Diplodia intermedia TaxID=856260 RepID=A0ABR3TR67_9PEZI
MFCVQFTRFTGDGKRHEPVEKVMAAELADFDVQALKSFLHTYYSTTDVEHELHVHYQNDAPCNGTSEISPPVWNALMSVRKAAEQGSVSPLYFICFANKGQPSSRAISRSNGRTNDGEDKPPTTLARSNDLPPRQVKPKTPSPPLYDNITVRPSPSESNTTSPARSRTTTTTVSPSKQIFNRKRQIPDQGMTPERPPKASRLAQIPLPQWLEDKLIGSTDSPSSGRRIVVGVDNDSGCAVWAARDTLGRLYLRKSAFDIDGDPVYGDVCGHGQKVESTDFLPIRGIPTADPSWDVVRPWVVERLDKLEAAASPRVKSAPTVTFTKTTTVMQMLKKAREIVRGGTGLLQNPDLEYASIGGSSIWDQKGQPLESYLPDDLQPGVQGVIQVKTGWKELVSK